MFRRVRSRRSVILLASSTASSTGFQNGHRPSEWSVDLPTSRLTDRCTGTNDAAGGFHVFSIWPDLVCSVFTVFSPLVRHLCDGMSVYSNVFKYFEAAAAAAPAERSVPPDEQATLTFGTQG